MATLLQRASATTLIGYPVALTRPGSTTTADLYLPAGEFLGLVATVDTGSVQTSVPSPEGSSTITVAAAQAWGANEQYVITSGALANFEPLYVTSAWGSLNTVMTMKQPLPRPVHAGCFIHSRAARVAITDVMTAEAGEGVAVWTTSVSGGEIRKWSQRLRVVQRVGAYTLTGERLTRLSPYAAARRPDTDGTYEEIVDAAWHRYLGPALAIRGVMPEQINTWAVIEPAHVAAVEMLLANSYDADSEMREEKRAAFTEAVRQALDNQGLWVQASTDNSVAVPAVRPTGMRAVMVTR
jgi:hypothetical protein